MTPNRILPLLTFLCSLLLVAPSSASAQKQNPPRLMVGMGQDYEWGFAFSSDGKTLASYGAGSSAFCLWDMETGKQIADVSGGSCRGLAFLDNDQTIVTVNDIPNVIAYYDVHTGKCVKVNAVDGGFPWNGRWNRNGRALIVSNRGRVKFASSLADLRDNRLVSSGVAIPNNFHLLDFSPNLRYLVGWKESNRGTYLYNMKSGEETKFPERTDLFQEHIARFLDDDGLLFINREIAGVWSVSKRSWRWRRKKSWAIDSFNAITYHPNNRLVATGTQEGAVVVRDFITGAAIFKKQLAEITALAFSPDGKRLVSGERGGTIRVWDVASGACKHTLAAPAGDVAFTADGRSLLSRSAEGRCRISNLENWSSKTAPGKFQSAQITSDGKWMVGRNGASLAFWNVERGKVEHTLPLADEYESYKVSEKGYTAYSVSWGKPPAIWDIPAGRRLQTIALKKDKNKSFGERAAQKPPEGKGLVDSEGNYTRGIPAKPGEIAEEDAFGRWVISPTGEYLATVAGFARTIYMWKLPEGRLLYTLPIYTLSDPFRYALGRKATSAYVAFAPSGQSYLDCLDSEKDAAVRDAKTGALQYVMKGAGGAQGFFTPDGKRLLTSAYTELPHRNPQESNLERAIALSLREVPSGKLINTIIPSKSYQYPPFMGNPYGESLVQILQNGKAFITKEGESAFSYWSLPKGDLLCRFFVCPDNDLLIMTPDGRYDGTPGGRERLYWVKDKRPYPLAAFPGARYAPGLLQVALPR